MKNAPMWIAYGIMWIAVSAAVCYGIYITKLPHCLLGLIIPLFVSFSSKSD